MKKTRLPAAIKIRENFAKRRPEMKLYFQRYDSLRGHGILINKYGFLDDGMFVSKKKLIQLRRNIDKYLRYLEERHERRLK